MTDKEDPKRFTWDEIGTLSGPPRWLPEEIVAALLCWTIADVRDACADGRLTSRERRGLREVATVDLVRKDKPFGYSQLMLRAGRLVERPKFAFEIVHEIELRDGFFEPREVAALTGQTLLEVFADVHSGRLCADVERDGAVDVSTWQFLDEAGLAIFVAHAMLPNCDDPAR